MKKVAVVGSRQFADRSRLEADLDRARARWGDFTVVSGGARGADSLAAGWARSRGLPTAIYLPDWDRHGKRAGYMRNCQIVATADALIAFWDGESRGTAHSIGLAQAQQKPVFIRRF